MPNPTGVRVDGDRKYSAETNRKHTFWIQNYVMTISYIVSANSQLDSDFPRYVLESSDGTYHRELSAGNDLRREGQYMQLRFDRLKPGKSYKLTRFFSEDFDAEIVFDEMPLDKIVDQDRSIHGVLTNHAYGEFQFERGSAKPLGKFSAD
jgi:hypothetical protein